MSEVISDGEAEQGDTRRQAVVREQAEVEEGREVLMESRRFELVRSVDVSGVSGVSGVGVVADGVLWPDGSVSVRWRGVHPSAVHWDSLADAESVHGHGGLTTIRWIDPVPPEAGLPVIAGLPHTGPLPVTSVLPAITAPVPVGCDASAYLAAYGSGA